MMHLLIMLYTYWTPLLSQHSPVSSLQSFLVWFSTMFSPGIVRCMFHEVCNSCCLLECSESTTDLGKGNVYPTLARTDRTSMIYAVFSTPRQDHRNALLVYYCNGNRKCLCMALLEINSESHCPCGYHWTEYGVSIMFKVLRISVEEDCPRRLSNEEQDLTCTAKAAESQ